MIMGDTRFKEEVADNITAIKNLLHKWGGFHDAELGKLHWNATVHEIIFELDDMLANFERIDKEYELTSGQIIFSGITHLDIDLKAQGHIYISDIKCSDEGMISAECSIGIISFYCISMEVRKKRHG